MRNKISDITKAFNLNILISNTVPTTKNVLNKMMIYVTRNKK